MDTKNDLPFFPGTYAEASEVRAPELGVAPRSAKRPALTIGVRPGVPPLYALAGWDELDMHASRNHPLWAAVRRRCMDSGITENDRLKMLCAALLDESESRKETIERYAAAYGFLPPNTVSATQR